MKNRIFLRSAFILKSAFVISMLLFATTFTNAQGNTFAQFTQKNGTNDFIFTNSFCSSGTLSTIEGGVPVNFFYLDVPNLPFELQGQQNARVFIEDGTSQPATLNGNRLVQPLNQTVTIRIIRDSAASSGGGSRTNLLTAVITTAVTPPDIAGELNSNAVALTASTPNQTIEYTSDFIDFSAPIVSRNLTLGFSSVTPVYTLGCGNFINSFTAAGTGTFAANPSPLAPAPTSASVEVSGRVMISKRTGLANARVTMTSVTGETATVITNSSGYYRFEGIPAGQAIVLGVSAKRYTYASKAVNAGENLFGLDFYPE